MELSPKTRGMMGKPVFWVTGCSSQTEGEMTVISSSSSSYCQRHERGVAWAGQLHSGLPQEIGGGKVSSGIKAMSLREHP